MSSSKEKSKVKQNRFLEIWKQFRRNKGAMFGLVVLILFLNLKHGYASFHTLPGYRLRFHLHCLSRNVLTLDFWYPA